MPSARTNHHALPRRSLGITALAVAFTIAVGLALESVVAQLEEERHGAALDAALALVPSLGLEGLRPLASPDSEASGGFLFAFDRRGARVLGPELSGESPLFEARAAQRMLAVGAGTVVVTGTDGGPFWCVYRALEPDGGVAGWAVPLLEQRARTSRVRRGWIAGALLVAALGLLTALLQRRRSVPPQPGPDRGELEAEAPLAGSATGRTQLAAPRQERDRVEALGHLARGVAHDFNNLLATVRGNAELLLLDLPEDASSEELRETADSILAVTKRGSELTARLMACTPKLESPRRIDCHRLIEEVLDATEQTCGPGIAIHRKLAAREHWLQGDARALKHVLTQLAQNACDAVKGRGTLTVATRDSTLPIELAPDRPRSAVAGVGVGPAILITVRDDGPGMDETTRARLFEPFFTTKDPGRGTGLGLTAVYSVVVGHRGSIEVESAPGAGTAVHVRLPRAPSEEQPSAPESA